MEQTSHIRFKTWFDTFCRDLENDYHIEKEVMAEIVFNVTREVNFDPFVPYGSISSALLPNKPYIPRTQEDTQSTMHNAVNSKTATDQDFQDGKMIVHGFKNPLKRERLDKPNPPSASNPAFGAARTANTTNTTNTTNTVDTTLLRGRDAQKFVEAQVEKGKWVAIQATVSRTGYGSGLYEFIIPGSENKTYDHMDCIKSAGYDHYSGNERGGWRKVILMHNGKTYKGFGKCMKWTTAAK